MTESIKTLRQEFGPLLRLAIPLVLAELGWMAMGIVDTMMVGRLPESAEAIGAVSIGTVTHYTVIFFGLGILLGLDTLVSQAFGAGKIEDCHHSLVSSFYLVLALTPVLMGIILVGIPLLPALGVHPEVLRGAVPYLKALNWGVFPLLLYFALRRYLQGMNLVHPVLFALITANLVNVAANWVLIYGHLGFPAMGVEGSGWATTISRTYLALVLIGYAVYYDRKHHTRLWHTPLAPDFARIRRLAGLGLPAALQLSVEIAGFATVTALIAKLDPISLASHHITLNAASFTYMMPLGVSSAAAVRVGQALGRKDPEGAGRSGWAALLLGAGLMTCAAAAFLLIPGRIARIFTPDPEVILLGISLLVVAAFFQLFDGLQIVATGALRGAGDTRTPMLTHLLLYWFIGLPLGYFLCFNRGWGALGLWTGLSVALILIGSVLLLVWYRTVKKLPALPAYH